MSLQTPIEGPPTITPDDLASPWRRIGADLIDGLIWGVPLALITFFAVVNRTTDAAGRMKFHFPFWWTPVALLFGILYQVVPIALWGQTLGKHLTKVRVVSAQDLTKPGWWRAIRRWGIYVLVGLIPIVGGVLNMLLLVIGLVLLWTDNRRQTIHDKVADTIVVNDGVHRF